MSIASPQLAFLLLKKFLFSRKSDSLIRIISWVCLSGVTVGIAAMIIVMSIMNGLNQNMHSRLLATEPHILLKDLSDDKLPLLKSLFLSDKLEKFERQDVIIKTLEGLYGGAVAKGIEPQAITRFLKGSDSFSKDFELGDGEVALGIDLAYSLHIFEDDELILTLPDTLLLGDTEIPKVEKVRVKKLLRTSVADVDSSMMIYNLSSKTLRTFLDSSSREKGVELYLADSNALDYSSKVLAEKKIPFSTWKEKNSHLLYALKMERLMIGTFLSMAILIAAFTILTVLAILIIQKRKDIGTLMSFGLSSLEASRTFTLLGFTLTSIGILSGTFLGLFVCLVLKIFPILRLPADIYYDSKVPISVSTQMVLSIVFFSLIVAYIGSLLPSRYIVKFTPAESLRTKA